MTELTVSGSAPAAPLHTNFFPGGKLLATYDFTGAQGLHYALADPLGTKRVQFTINSSGLETTELNCLSLPFGNSLNNSFTTDCVPVGTSGADATEHHFTGKERDTESGNDYFGARYYASSMGRFMSPDPMSPMSKGKGAAFMEYIGQPQNWNRYAYVRNNPMALFDPDGKETQVAIGGRVGDNVFGHAAIIINGKVYSFGTNYTKGPSGKLDWGGDANTYLQGNAAKGRSTDLLTLNITPAQEKTLQQQLDSNNPNAPGTAPYSIPNGNSCVDQVQNPLVATGILPATSSDASNPAAGLPGVVPAPGSPVTPSGLESELQSQPGLVQSTQTVGQSNTGFFQSLWGTIKHALGGQ